MDKHGSYVHIVDNCKHCTGNRGSVRVGWTTVVVVDAGVVVAWTGAKEVEAVVPGVGESENIFNGGVMLVMSRA